MNFEKIAVVGAGTMGNGIAHVFAQNNFKVTLVDKEQAFVDRGLSIISANLDRQIKKNMIGLEDKQRILDNIQVQTQLSLIPKDVDLLIEAIYENKDAKLLIFNELEKTIEYECIFATNTSSISITELAATSRADRFIGMHFMNPVPVMQLVEVIRGYSTSQQTFDAIVQLSIAIGKTPVEVNDYPGFIANRILMPMINEAVYSLYENVASAKDIDTVMKLGMNHPMGPLTLADFIGLDVCLSIMEVLYNGFNDSKYRPCPLLKKMVSAGKLGRKSGEGFFIYTEKK
ncbi:MAG: 3-hydroxybutyryl-CoA dehydrogenase [Bacteroidetes bacterium]|nr:3-hydroxybutyryl-CoA dehydrogenase [Bacteroidota bacterium]